MTKKITMIIMAGVLAASVCFANDDSASKPRAPIGSRAEPVEQLATRLQAREEAAVKQEKKRAQSKRKGKTNLGKETKGEEAFFFSSRKTYYTTHPAAYQNPIAISFYGDSIELTDGSIWTVKASDAYKAINWFPTDLVVITPNQSWFSYPYSYRLTNQNTGESVAVALYLGPISPDFGSIYTHWITAIDYYSNVVYLEDGSAWDMSAFDSNVVDQWAVGDVVIIGVNDGWFSSSNPNILINVDMLNYAAGAVL